MQKLLLKLQQYAFAAAQEISNREKARSALGALIGIGLTSLLTLLMVGADSGLPFIVAPLGASAVIVFALHASPLAQPWPVFAGNTLSALVGISCGLLLPNPLAAGTVAVCLAILLMFATRSLHPPGGAAALLTALGSPAITKYGLAFALVPVAVNSALIVAAAVAYNRLCGRRYPHTHVETDKKVVPHRPHPAVGVTPADLDAVLRQHNELLDISRDDLEDILKRAEMRAWHRHFGTITCADIMSRDLVKAEFGTEIREAWSLLRDHELQALPVVNRFGRLIGMVNQHDMLVAADHDVRSGFWPRLHALLQPSRKVESDKPEVVGQIMSDHPPVVYADQPITDLVSLMCDQGVHQVPVLDRNERLVGLVAQADMVAALYQSSFETPAPVARRA
jgi:CBS domain-containing membrane protein